MKKLFLLLMLFAIILSMGVFAVSDARAYYSWDEDKIIGSVIVDSAENYNWTLQTGLTANHNGIINESGKVASSYYLLSNIPVPQNTGQSATLCSWIYDTSPTTQNVNYLTTDNGGFDWGIRGNTGKAHVATGTDYWTSSSNIYQNQWFHYCGTFSSSNVCVYINGVEDCRGTGAGFDASANNIFFGLNSAYDVYYDEVAIYDRVLNVTEIQTLYNSGAGYNPYSVTPPVTDVVNLTTPTDNFVTNNQTINFSYTTTITNPSCELYGNWSGSWASNGTITNSKLLTLDVGNYSWNVNCNNTFATSNYTFEINDLFSVNVTANADSYVYQASATTNYGSTEYLQVGYDASNMRYAIINFSRSNFEDYVENAILHLYLELNSLDSGEYYNISVHKVYNNYSWQEDTITWNNAPANGTNYENEYSDSNYFTFGTTLGWYDWNVTDIVNEMIRDDYDSLTFYLYTYNGGGTPASSDYTQFSSSEDGVTSRHPYLSVDYYPATIVTLLEPNNTIYLNDNNVTFVYNTTIENPVCELFGNFTGVWKSNTTITNNVSLVLDDGVYIWNVNCSGTFAFYNNTLTIDTIAPYITLDSGMQNRAYYGVLTGQINFTDDNLYSINISDNVSGTIFYNISYGGSELLYNFSLNISNYPIGQNTISIVSTDGHTAKTIKEYQQSKGLFDNYIDFEFDNGYVRINPEGLSDDLTTTKLKDRYKFNLESDNLKNKFTFYVSSNHYIDYLEDSNYKAHFVIPALNKWVDFEIDEKYKDGKETYTITKISDNEYKVEITKLNNVDYLEFNSIGDLNINNVTLTWYNTNATYSYEAIVSESSTQDYTFTLYYDGLTGYFDDIDVVLIWNGTRIDAISEYTPVSEYTGGFTTQSILEETTWSFEKTIPIIIDNQQVVDIDFEINITQNGSSNYYYVNDTQTILKLVLGLCSDVAFNTSSFNVYGFNEENYNESLNFTINVDFELFLTRGDTTSSVSLQSKNKHNHSFCLVNNESNMIIDATLEFFDDAGKFANRKYYLYNFNLNNTAQSINLYLLNDTIASDIIHSVKDSNGQPIPNVFVKVLRFYPELGQSFVVEIGKTNNEGQTGTKQVLADPLYSYIIQQGTNVRLATSSGRLLSTTKTFTLGRETNELESFKGLLDIEYNLFYDEATHKFNFVWNDANGITDTMCLEVWKRDGFKDTIVCDKTTNCLTANAGNLYCDIGANPSGQYFAQVYLESNTAYSNYIFISLDKLFKTTTNYGKQGIFSAILLITAVSLSLTFSPIAVIIGGIVGVVASVLLGILSMGAGIVITLIVIGVIIIVRLKE